VTSEALPAETQTQGISVRQVTVEYDSPDRKGQVFQALDRVDLDIQPDEFVTILGPSGCGKSTLLMAIAGLIAPSAGTITMGGKPIDGPSADRGVVFQDYALLPWKTVRQNITLGLKIRKEPKRAREAAAEEYLRLFRLDGFGDRYPHQLSGGMRQRVAVARALANNPKAVLMDEPFAAVDAQTRSVLGEELARISAVHRMTVAFVTHSVEEAVLLGDRVVVMTPRPAQVHTIFDVPFERTDRTWNRLRDEASLLGLVRQATDLLHQMGTEPKGPEQP
jgi:NitT/TauT family transport system ATP-binding protein